MFRYIMTGASIQIQNPDVVRDIHTLADRLGLPVAEVVADAVRRRLSEEDTRTGAARGGRAQRLADALAAIDALPHAGQPLSDDDLYGADGLPR
jgi:hypothetical protein